MFNLYVFAWQKEILEVCTQKISEKCWCVPAKSSFLCLLCDSRWELGHINEAPWGEEEMKTECSRQTAPLHFLAVSVVILVVLKGESP